MELGNSLRHHDLLAPVTSNRQALAHAGQLIHLPTMFILHLRSWKLRNKDVFNLKKYKNKKIKKERKEKKKEEERKQDQEQNGSVGASTCLGVSLMAFAHFWNSCKRPATEADVCNLSMSGIVRWPS